MPNLGSILRDAVVESINASACVAATQPPVAAYGFDPGSSDDQIRRRLTESGLTIMVPLPDCAALDDADPARLGFDLTVTIGERSRINRGPTGTGVSPYDLAWSLAAVLDGRTVESGWAPLEFMGLEQQQGADAETRDIYIVEARFRTSCRYRVTSEAEA